MKRYRPKSRKIPRRPDDQPYLFEGMHQHYYGFDVRVAVGEFFERVAQAVYGGHAPSKFNPMYNIDIWPDLTNGRWWREVKGQKTGERLMIRHVQLWRYMTLMSCTPSKRFHYVICRHRTKKPLKTYKGDKDLMQEALGWGLKTIIQMPFSLIFRVAMLPEDRERVYRPNGEYIEEGSNRFYMTTWWQCGRVRELVDQGLPALKKMQVPFDQYTEHRWKCKLEGTEDFEIIHINEKRSTGAQRDLLAEYDGELGHFIDLENGVYDRSVEDADESFAGDFEDEEQPELLSETPF